MQVPLMHIQSPNGYYDGWVITDHPLLNHGIIDEGDAYLTPMMVAHDVIEHVNGWQNIGTVEDELQALGAAVFTRVGQTEVTEHGIASDVAGNLEYVLDRQLKTVCTHQGDEGDVLNYISQEAARIFYRNACYYGDGREQKLNAIHNIEQVIHWMRIGYRKARAKYKESGMACSLFHSVQSVMEEASKYVNDYEPVRYILHYRINKADAWMEEHHLYR